MTEFRIKSSDTDLELILSDIKGDYFKVHLVSAHLQAMREVWAYTDAYGFADLFKYLASKEKPWEGEETWQSIEGEFKFSATCNHVGKIKFVIELNHFGCTEEWQAKTEINSEFGQLPHLAKKAREFFGESSS